MPALNFWPFVRSPPKAPPLHRALENADGLLEDERCFLVEELATKRQCKKKDSFERTPLHVACMNQPDIDTIMMLIDVYPKAINLPDKVGRLPLHTACANQASLEVIEYLLRQDPETIHEVTDRGVSFVNTRNILACSIVFVESTCFHRLLFTRSRSFLDTVHAALLCH